jgi:hypothetical protein
MILSAISFITSVASFFDTVTSDSECQLEFDYASSENLHENADDDAFRPRLSEVLSACVCQRRYLIAPEMGLDGAHVPTKLVQKAPFEECFDLPQLNQLLHPFNVKVVSDECRLPLTATTFVHEACVATIANSSTSARSQTIVDWRRTVWPLGKVPRADTHVVEQMRRILLQLMPARRLADIAHRIIERHTKGSFACVYVTSDQWNTAHTNATHAYSLSAVADRVIASRRALALPDVIYVAGETADEAEHRFGSAFVSVLSRRALRELSALRQLHRSLVDEAVCREATVFIGNNRNAWSQQVAFHRMLKKPQVANLQYNGAQGAPTLSAFCGGHNQDVLKLSKSSICTGY